jgi:hypothetical protein
MFLTSGPFALLTVASHAENAHRIRHSRLLDFGEVLTLEMVRQRPNVCSVESRILIHRSRRLDLWNMSSCRIEHVQKLLLKARAVEKINTA